MPSRSYCTLEAIMRAMKVQEPFRGEVSTALAYVDAWNEKNSKLPTCMNAHCDVSLRHIDGQASYVLRSRRKPTRRRVLLIHGGGGMMRANPFHFHLASILVNKAQAEVWMPFYPLGPKANFFGSLDACLAAYGQMLLEGNPVSGGLPIFLAGDSAGANLELALTRLALDAQLPAPAGIVCISPFTGFEDPKMHAQMHAKELAERDPMLCVEMIEGIRDYWYAGVPLESPLGNPAFIDYRGFPPVLLFLGTAEIFYPYTKAIAHAMDAAGVKVDCVYGEGLMHDWAMLDLYPEGRDALKRMQAFLGADPKR